MPTHIFAVGERVSLGVTMRNTHDSTAVFVVKNRLPHVGAELQYRIRAEAEPHDRVVTEGLLSRVGDPTEKPDAAATTVVIGG